MNAYYNPSAIGLKLVAEWETTPASYSFDTVILVQSVLDGSLWLAHDSGCSCPTPFDDVEFPAQFTPARTIEDVVRFCDEHKCEYGENLPVNDFLAAAREALR